ncbi:MAG: thioredoxin, partial [Tenericutes bacterium HGW-Tenericutes-6]
MKKIIGLFVIIFSLFLLVACGNDEPNDSTPTTPLEEQV